MRCRYCRDRAGFLRRECADCRRLFAITGQLRGADMGTLAAAFHDTGIAFDKVERFLDADPSGAGSVRDQIAADATNQLMEGLGSRHRQSAKDIAKLRAKGTWRSMDRRPDEPES